MNKAFLYGITCCGGNKAAEISKKRKWVEHLTVDVVGCLHRICFLLGLQFLDNAIV